MFTAQSAPSVCCLSSGQTSCSALAAGASRTKAAVAPPLPAAGPKLSAATSGSGFRFTFGRGGDGELVFQMQSTFSVSTNPNFRSTRVRIDSFSHVRAVLETEDGTLHMATKFVAAAGGCGAMQGLQLLS